MIVKALREALILTKFPAEVRAYAVAVIALVLMLVIPIYGVVRRRLDGARLLQAITIFFALSMLVFVYIAHSGVNIAFAFFVWVSIYGVMVVAQFWAFAADSFNLKSGQRLFPVIMLGANFGRTGRGQVRAARGGRTVADGTDAGGEYGAARHPVFRDAGTTGDSGRAHRRSPSRRWCGRRGCSADWVSCSGTVICC
jgi:hypothetical protein